ncbi:hypothetical protein [Ramlibacter albus]|uniref:Uncharacterized protein n=1 Tax=Ramlibacter albus TaxID=2079448 RepID=A0A923MD89_9BURK|nr:hypothetical protein [Ramlibacter albus]MBC5768031.1 hypothetical protein [Ramlibacter albus]
MNTKTLATIAAAIGVTVGGIAVAQAQYITSTPGNGATATCNTLRGGTGAHRPDPNACAPKAAPIASIQKVEEVAVVPQPEVMAQAPAVQEMGAPPAPEPEVQPMRPARADRG